MELRAAREQSGKTQVQVAKEVGIVGIAEAVYQRYEYSKSTPSATTAIRIARALNSTVEALFGVATPDNTKKSDGNQTKKEVQANYNTTIPKGSRKILWK